MVDISKFEYCLHRPKSEWSLKETINWSVKNGHADALKIILANYENKITNDDLADVLEICATKTNYNMWDSMILNAIFSLCKKRNNWSDLGSNFKLIQTLYKNKDRHILEQIKTSPALNQYARQLLFLFTCIYNNDEYVLKFCEPSSSSSSSSSSLSEFDPTICDNLPLRCAMMNNNGNIVKILLKHPLVLIEIYSKEPNQKLNSALRFACMINACNIVKMVLNAIDLLFVKIRFLNLAHNGHLAPNSKNKCTYYQCRCHYSLKLNNQQTTTKEYDTQLKMAIFLSIFPELDEESQRSKISFDKDKSVKEILEQGQMLSNRYFALDDSCIEKEMNKSSLDPPDEQIMLTRYHSSERLKFGIDLIEQEFVLKKKKNKNNILYNLFI